MATTLTLSKLPSAGPEREALREKGQFWTPDWIAEGMVGYVVAGGCNSIFDPAVGAGAFFRAAKQIGKEINRPLKLLGAEIDNVALKQAEANGLTTDDLSGVEIRDFVLNPPTGSFKGIVANPPYIRHHRLGSEMKTRLQAFGAALIGRPLDGRAGVHVYFLLRALQLLDRDGRLAFIMPADTCEGVFAPTLWNWISRHYRLEAVLTFAPEASPFPGVDTNPIIFMIRNATPDPYFFWARCNKVQRGAVKKWTLSGLKTRSSKGLTIYRRSLAEGLATGLSRPSVVRDPNAPTLGHFAKVLRGIATGANEFFFLTKAQAVNLQIPQEFLIPAVGRTRDVPGDVVTTATLEALEAAGRATLLFSPDGRPLNEFPKPVREYLKRGEEMGFPSRPLIASRKPWYKMERRQPPAILFAYLGRRNARFVRNVDRVIPLTGFLCIYPHRTEPVFLEKLWQALRDPDTIANLRLVGKSYGQGCIKVEPRALEKLPLASSALPENDFKSGDLELPLSLSTASAMVQATLVREKRTKYYRSRRKSYS